MVPGGACAVTRWIVADLRREVVVETVPVQLLRDDLHVIRFNRHLYAREVNHLLWVGAKVEWIVEPAAIGHIVAAHRLTIRIRIGCWNSGPNIQDHAHFNLRRCGAHRAHRHAVSE